MGHHFDDQGRFQSDKHPELPPDRIRLSLEAPLSLRALLTLAEDKRATDPGLSEDLEKRLREIHGDEVDRAEQAMLILAECDGTLSEELREKIEAFMELKGSRLHNIQILVTNDSRGSLYDAPGMFMFGSMRDPRVLEAVLGRPLDGLTFTTMTLRDHTVLCVEGEDYPALAFQVGSSVLGEVVHGLTPADLARIEFWEDFQYGLATMFVYDANETQHEARVYATTSNRVSGQPWDFDTFAKSVPEYLNTVREWMARFKA